MEQTQNSLHREILEFLLSTLWLGAAFAIALSGGYTAFKDPANLKITLLQAIIVVFFTFVCHELAHRITARRYGYKATFHIWMPGLLLALAGSLIGMIFAAPGAVYLEAAQTQTDSRRKLGITALAGPAVNIVMAILMAVATVIFIDWAKTQTITPGLNFVFGVLETGVIINVWSAVFNMLPVGQFDGFKVFLWNKVVWLVTFAISIGLFCGMFWFQSHFLV